MTIMTHAIRPLLLAAGALAVIATAARADAPPAAGEKADAAAIAAALDAQQARYDAAPSPGGPGAHQFSFDGLMAERIPLAAFAGDVVLVVNTASECGFTPQ
ncbi:MAG: hypothetical protein ACX939_07595, partial [Hyphococcus sp.]